MQDVALTLTAPIRLADQVGNGVHQRVHPGPGDPGDEKRLDPGSAQRRDRRLGFSEVRLADGDDRRAVSHRRIVPAQFVAQDAELLGARKRLQRRRVEEKHQRPAALGMPQKDVTETLSLRRPSISPGMSARTNRRPATSTTPRLGTVVVKG